MIVKLTPDVKFVCDRCGKEEFPDDEMHLHPYEVVFTHGLILKRIHREGQVCKACYDEFLELADNYFNEVNKEYGNEGNTF